MNFSFLLESSFISKVDSQLQEQLFKLYHNERAIEDVTEELRGKQKDLERMVKSGI